MTAEQVENIPASLRAIPRWLTRYGKIPTDHGGRARPSGTPIEPTLDTFEVILAAAERSGQEIGFYFDNDDVIGIDLDHCVKDGVIINGTAQKIVDAMNSYTEITPRLEGLHIIVLGTMPTPEIKAWLTVVGNEPTRVELYARGAQRYFTFTGNHLAGTPLTVEARQALVTQTYNHAVEVNSVVKNSSGSGDYFKLPAVIDVDSRHDTLRHFGCSLRYYGFEFKEILAAATVINGNPERMPVPLGEKDFSKFIGRAVKSFKGTPQELPGTLLEVGRLLRSRYNLALCEMIPILEAVDTERNLPAEPNPHGDKEAFEQMLVNGDSK